ncbi:MAG TPA: heme o synthase [Thermoplasmata archaeon]|nr:heme o synthase [Thermoplasmata archaeon]
MSSLSTPSPPAESLRWRDVLTLTKPGITALIVLVAVGGFFLAAPNPIPYGRLAELVGFGALASAGSAMLNHYLDRDLDARMRRTRGRPLPSERIGASGGVALGGLLLLGVGIAGASVLLNPLTGFSIFLGGLTYVVVYTIWLKRRSSWNIVIGGFAGSAPALAGSAAALGYWTPGVLALALLVFLWTPPHFWSLALLLRADYEAVGLPMLPRMDDPKFSGRVVVLSAAVLLPATFLLWWVGPIAWPVAVALVGLGVGFFVVSLPLWSDPGRRRARWGFIYSGPYLLGVLLALVANWWLVSAGVRPGF